MTSGSTVAAGDRSSMVGTDEPAGGWRRHPADLARFLAALAGLLAVLGVTHAEPEVVTGVSGDLLDLVGWFPPTLREAALGIAQLVAVVGPVVLSASLVVRRQLRHAAAATGAGLASAILASRLQGWLDDTAPPELLGRLDSSSWLTGAAFPSPAYLAAATAAVTVLVPGLGPTARRAVWWSLGGLALVRLVTAIAIPLHVGATVLLGLCVGSGVLAVVGVPSRRSRGDVGAALDAAGVTLEWIEEGPGSWRDARTDDGTDVLVRVVGRDERDADALYRLWARVQRRGLGGERPAWSPRRLVEHEALVTMLAANSGVRTPEVVGVGGVDEQVAVLVVRDDSRAIGDSDAELDDSFLHDLWTVVAAMHAAGIAHRRLHLGNVRVDADGAHLRDFRDAEISAPDELLAADVAELLVSLARRIGAERAVASSAVLGPERLGAALAYLQPLALSPYTRQLLGRDGKAGTGVLLAGLRDELQRAADVEAASLAPLQRISLGRIVGLFGTVVLAYVLLTFVSNGAAIADALGEADLSRLPLIVAFTAVTYVSGALALSGAVTVDLPLTQTSAVMLAQSFLNRFTPANAGGMALRARYLQRHGVELTVAAASVGLTSAASGVAQVLFLVVFLTWSGSSERVGFELPDASGLAVGVLVVAVAGGLVYLTPLRDRILGHQLWASVGTTIGELRTLATRPGKLARLLGGSILGKLVVLLAFVQSVRSFGVDLGFAELGALYLTANTVASAAPTPGGVGAIEAALVAVLTGAGVEPASALSAVLVFRLVTFWLPVPPAWFTLRHLRATEVV